MDLKQDSGHELSQAALAASWHYISVKEASEYSYLSKKTDSLVMAEVFNKP